jgi:hypothetical protein
MSIDVGIVMYEILVSENVLRTRCAVKLVRRAKEGVERRSPMPYRAGCAHIAVIGSEASDAG